MIVLDTNVISALMREKDDPIVRQWLDGQPMLSIWTTSVTVFELRFGLELLPPGRRRDALSLEMIAILQDDLRGRILGLGGAEASEAAILMARQKAAGRPAGSNDAMIAGIVRTHRATLATRNTRHFAGAGIALVDPWAPPRDR